MKRHYLATLLLLSLFSCVKTKFDAGLWQRAGLQNDYKHRSTMAEDLVKTNMLKGKRYTQVINLLGKPDESPGFSERGIFYIHYPLKVSWDQYKVYDPVVTERLVIAFGKDSLVQSYSIEDRNYLLNDR